MSRTAGLLIVALLAGCAGKETRPDSAAVGVAPKPIVITEIRYRELPPELLEDCPIAEGEVHEIGAVSRARKKSLQDCNADKASLRALSGTKPVD
jgi:hypothetical protein